ncbi:spore coat associated protein CotJA [Faecalicatena contorta]|uniref:spore coat associated protein CotJA n=1 Tax=Faecalicatena contorta TaxID=39482 RepID=UPI0019617850|nr:spore coat associated protein CotJA [Faecalicatena contorta]MBM6685058.1 spore coat associated protein CotJA [Faecalicatena contorta]MBM6710586.1 spore coat associated protein CotJA [Faecalicatena contorta]
MPNYRYQTQDCQSRQGRSCPNQGMYRGAQQSGRQQSAMGRAHACGKDARQLSDLPVAMAYVPWQEWYGIFDLEKGFCCGTIFEELNKPFTGAGGRR